MKIAIFSDIHDNLSNLKKALQVCQERKIKSIFFLGDLCSPFTLSYLGESKAKVYFVFGNNDGDKVKIIEKAKNFPNIEIFYENVFGEKKISGVKIGFVHWREIALRMAQSRKYKVVLFGHTHKKEKKKIGKTLMINPGEIGGNLFPPSFAILDLKTFKVEFIDLEKIPLIISP